MNDFIYKYFNGELTDKEKEEFLLSVIQDSSLEKEFIQIHNLLCISNMSPREEDTENAKISLSKFIQKRNNKNETLR